MRNSPLKIFLLCGAVLSAGWFASAAHAQEESAVEQAAEAGTPEAVSLMDLIMQGGWAMYPLGLLSVMLFGLVIYNLIAIRPKPFLRPDVVDQLRDALSQKDIERAKEVCGSNPCIVSNITSAGVERLHSDELDIIPMEKAMEESSIEELSGPYVMINLLAVIATVAPMVGLLGTVSGMIRAFRIIAAGGMGQPELLADAISEALITTATGLIVGIPAMIAYFVFKNLYNKMTSRLARICGDLFNSYSRAVRGSSGQNAPAPAPAD